MDYKRMSIEELEALSQQLYEQETNANNERKEVAKVLRLKYKQREAGVMLADAEAVLAAANAELVEPSFWDGLREKLGL